MRNTELDVVNACLATVGEAPLVALIEEHPLVAAARLNFKECLISEMHRAWWFNTDYAELYPTADYGYVYAPEDAVSVVPLDRTDLTLRGRRLYNRTFSTYEIKNKVYCEIVRDIPYEDLPTPAQLLVQHATVIRFQMNYDADTNKAALQRTLYANQLALLNAEHTRQVDLNFLTMPELSYKRRKFGVHRRGSGIPVR